MKQKVNQTPQEASLNLKVRAAEPKDLAALAEIVADSFHPQATIVRWVYPLLRMGIYEDLRTRLRSTSLNHICLVAVISAKTQANYQECLVGTVEIGLRKPPFWLPSNPTYPYISNLAVHRAYRQQGVAQQLLNACERKSSEWGHQDLYLHVLENNHQARQLYLKVGYKLKEIEPSWFCFLFRQPRRLFLQKHLRL